ncbi:unnamed protein product [Linum trigynum]|uniref:MULE transposase domain-containing protein n=1 Tax=Linum trigynum TaxID=586398 RepID=A0AAV2DX41_9ROSI
MRVARLAGMTPLEWTFQDARKKGYYVTHLEDHNELTHLFLAHPESILMLRAWYHVVVIDSTYKTNEYGMPCVEIVGVTLVNLNFNIAGVLVLDETKDTYLWILQHLKHLLGDVIPDAIVSDKEGGLLVIVVEVFPLSRHLLCVWHIEQNVQEKCMTKVCKPGVDKAAAKKIVVIIIKGWKREVYAPTVEEMELALNGFRRG